MNISIVWHERQQTASHSHPSAKAAAAAAAAAASSTSSPFHFFFPACQTLHVAKAMVAFPKHVRPACNHKNKITFVDPLRYSSRAKRSPEREGLQKTRQAGP